MGQADAGPPWVRRLLQIQRREAIFGFAVAALVAYAILLVAGRHGTFRQDEWAFLEAPPTSLESYLVPQNEHWSTIAKLIYQTLLDRIGLRSYLPYLAVLGVFHLLTVTGAFVLLLRRIPPGAALVVAVPLLLLGSGWESLLWPVLIQFVASAAAGTWALIAIEDKRRIGGPIAAVLLVVALASSTFGLFFMGAAGLRALLDRRLRSRVVWLAVPLLVYIAWYVGYGRHAIKDDWASPLATVLFGVRGLSYAVGRALGLDLAGRAPLVGQVAGFAVIVSWISVLGWLAFQRRTPPLAVAGVAAAAVMYVVIGLARADEESGSYWNRSRHVYQATVLLIPAAADLIRTFGAGVWSSARFLVAGALLVGLALGANLLDLRSGRAALIADAEYIRAVFSVLDEHRGAPWLDPRGLPPGLSSLESAYQIIDRYGNPIDDILVPSNILPSAEGARDRAIIGLSLASFQVSQTGSLPGRAVQATTTGVRDIDTSPDGDCIVGVARTGGVMTLGVPPGGWIELERRAGEALSATLGREAPPTDRFGVAIPSGQKVRLSTPDPGDGLPWQIQLRAPAGASELRVCVRQP